MAQKPIQTDKAPAPIGPYNQCIEINNTFYISGQIPLEVETGNIISGDIIAATHKVMENIGAILKEAGLTYDNVVKVSIFLKDMDNFKTVNDTYGPYFKNVAPAREAIQAARLPKDVDIEISCIAAL